MPESQLPAHAGIDRAHEEVGDVPHKREPRQRQSARYDS